MLDMARRFFVQLSKLKILNSMPSLMLQKLQAKMPHYPELDDIDLVDLANKVTSEQLRRDRQRRKPEHADKKSG